MKNRKLIKMFLILIIILLIALVTVLMCLTKSDSDNTQENVISNNHEENTEEPTLYTSLDLEELESSKILLAIQDCIGEYYKYIYDKNTVALVNVLSSDYIGENGINQNNVINYVETLNNSTNFFAEQVYSVELVYDMEYKYYVYGEAYDDNLKKVSSYMYILYLNTYNNAFYIEPYGNITEDNFTEKIEDLLLENTNELTEVTDTNSETIVELNKYNKYSMKTDTELTENIILNALKYYNFLQENDVNRQYLLLDENYRILKYGNINNFSKSFNYLDVNLSYVRKSYVDEKTLYIGIDDKERYYIIVQESPTNFTIMLDSYTNPLSETVQKYEDSSEAEKACMCVEFVKEMINNNDYQSIYNHLNATFATNNFSTVTDLQKYIETNYFDWNTFEYELCSESSGSYIVKIKVLNLDDNSDYFETSFVVKLGDEIDEFEMSFSVN